MIGAGAGACRGRARSDNRTVRQVLLTSLLAFALAGCGAASTYDVEEAVDAFEHQGYTLKTATFPDGTELSDGDARVLVPSRRRRAFFVWIGRDDVAAEIWADYERLGEGTGSFHARRANVLVISDRGLPVPERKRVMAALAELPDRGAEIETAGDSSRRG